MITNGSYTVDSLRHIPNLIVVPVLFDDPPEGYIEFTRSLVPDPIPVRKGTIPGMILEAEGQASLWGLTLLKVVSGEHESKLLATFDTNDTAVQAVAESDQVDHLEWIADNVEIPHKIRWAAKAKSCRLRFDAGDPLYIGMWQNVHRYRNVEPVLRYGGQGHYLVGSRQNNLVFDAGSHTEAIDRARAWYEDQHHQEIDEAKKRARTQNIPRLVCDVLGAVLDKDNEIYDQHDTRVAWKNGSVHSRYGIVALDWCYIIKGASATAGMMLAIAQQEAKQAHVFAPLRLNISGRLHDYFGFQIDGDRLACDWGEWRPSQKASGVGAAYAHDEGKPRFQFRWGLQDGVYHCRVMSIPQRHGQEPDVLVKSTVPRNWNLTTTDLIAWGFYSGLVFEQRKAQSVKRKAKKTETVRA